MMQTGVFAVVALVLLIALFSVQVVLVKRQCDTVSEELLTTRTFKSQREKPTGWTILNRENDNTADNVTTFEILWPDLKEKLCPNMVPNTALGPTIFALARDQIGMEPWSANEEQKRRNSKFFTFKPKPGFIYTSTENQKTIYLAMWKAGNDQIRYGSEELLKGQPGTFLTEDGLVTTGDEGKHFFSSEGNMCIVTAVRDPVSHFLSGYNEAETRCCVEKTPMNIASQSVYSRYAAGTTQRFEYFVADFVGGVTDDSLQQAYVHFYSMTGWLTALAKWDLKLDSYLPTLNNLRETWMPFVNSTCNGIPKQSVRTLPKYKDHKSQSDPGGFYKAAKKVWAAQGPTARALCALHVMDYSCYDGLPEGIPDLCKEVFANPRFSGKINAALVSK